MKTSADVMVATGIKSTHTLVRWHKAGLIPPPTAGVHPSGRGRVSLWEDWVIVRCQQIIKARSRGESMTSIKKRIDAHQLGGPDAAGKSDFPKSVASVVVYEAGKALGLAEDTLNHIQAEFLVGGHYEHAKALEAEGINPILIYRQRQVAVIADFELSHLLAGSHFGCEFVVLPLGAHMAQLFEIKGSRRVFPAERVVVAEGDVVREVALQRVGQRLMPVSSAEKI